VKRKRTEITIEVDEVIYLAKQPRPLPRLWCESCGNQSTMVTPRQASVMTGVTVRIVNRWVESDLVHFIETEDGLLLVCVSSLSQKRVAGARTLGRCNGPTGP